MLTLTTAIAAFELGLIIGYLIGSRQPKDDADLIKSEFRKRNKNSQLIKLSLGLDKTFPREFPYHLPGEYTMALYLTVTLLGAASFACGFVAGLNMRDKQAR